MTHDCLILIASFLTSLSLVLFIYMLPFSITQVPATAQWKVCLNVGPSPKLTIFKQGASWKGHHQAPFDPDHRSKLGLQPPVHQL